MLSIAAPAKVNLFLGVGAVRDDGYHEVRTVLHVLEFGDTVHIEPAAALSLACDADLDIPPERNLAYRAAQEMSREFDRPADVAIRIEKRIPHGAGLGGGSSDAAAVIRGLAAMWGFAADDERCMRVGASLGADVPFFLVRGGAALMTGRGDVPERVFAGMPGVPVVLVKPSDPVPTAAAYAAFDEEPREPGSPAAVIDALDSSDRRALAGALSNNMEHAAARVTPAVGEALEWTAAQPGVLGALVSGSGSAVFAITGSDAEANAVAAYAESAGLWAVATRLGIAAGS